MPNDEVVLDKVIDNLSKQLISGSIKKTKTVVFDTKTINSKTNTLTEVIDQIKKSDKTYKNPEFKKSGSIKIKTEDRKVSDPIWLM